MATEAKPCSATTILKERAAEIANARWSALVASTRTRRMTACLYCFRDDRENVKRLGTYRDGS
jgi:hypothetical protein